MTKHFNIFLSLLLVINLLSYCYVNKNTSDKFYSKGKINFKLSIQEQSFLDSLQYYSFRYFLNEINPKLGLVKDRTADWSAASIAAMGFALPIYAIGAERKWVSRNEAVQKTLTMLEFLLNSEQSTDILATGYKGFYYHFLDMNTGRRTWESELSTIDTGLLIAGIIFARQYYNTNDSAEKKIREIATQLINRLDWNFFRMKTNDQYNNSICMGWYPEKGFHHMGWIGYNEAILLYILAAGGNLKNPKESYQAWLNTYDWREPYPGIAHAVFPPMFGHQYSHMFIDFRGLADHYLKEKGIDYFENSRRAAYTQRQYAIDNPKGWVGYDSLCWGITACDGPGESHNYNGKKFLSYAGRGTSGPDLVYLDDGTIAPTATAGSIVFAPEIVIPALMNIHNVYSSKGLWSKYGLLDAFNPTLNWFNDQYIGIDQGPIVIMIENFRTGLVWNYFMKDPVIQKGLSTLGFEYIN
ncbi:MAG: Tat pathway signal protein [Bacteroidetes bacterium]|nr:Tat pathway signal protein [Bacteroidota bacterium]